MARKGLKEALAKLSKDDRAELLEALNGDGDSDMLETLRAQGADIAAIKKHLKIGGGDGDDDPDDAKDAKSKRKSDSALDRFVSFLSS